MSKAKKTEVENEVAVQNREASKGQLVVTSASGSVAIPEDMAAAYEAEAGAGQENITTEQMLVPELKVLQKMSPACDPDDSGYVEGASPGMFYDNLNQRLFEGKQGVLMVPIYYSLHFVEFVPISKGGGFVADHGDDKGSVVRNECEWDDDLGMLIRKSTGNQIVETHQFVSIVIGPDGNAFPALVRFSGSKVKCGKKLNSLIKQKYINNAAGVKFPAPAFGFSYKVTTKATENDKGKFYVTEIQDHGPTYLMDNIGKDVFSESKNLFQGFKNNKVQVQGFEETSVTDVADDKEIPF